MTQNPNDPPDPQTATGKEERPDCRVEIVTVHSDLRNVRAEIAAVLNAATTGPAFTDTLAALIADIPGLLSDVDRLHATLAVARRRYADLVAASRATLVAVLDGDPDGWRFLADELPPAPPGHPLWTHQDRRGWGWCR